MPPARQHSSEAVQALSDAVTKARYFKEGAKKQAVENCGTLLLREWGGWLLADVDIMKHERFSYNCCSFLMFLVQYFSYPYM